MTDREKAIVMAYTGSCMLEGEKLGVFNQYLEELYDRPVYTHEWVTLDIKEKSKPDFLQLCKEEEPEPTERIYKRGYADGYHKAEKDYFERSEKDRADAYKAGVEIGRTKRKRGRWVLSENQNEEDVANGNYLFYCSECGKGDTHCKEVTVSFCWNCGANMTEEKNETP